MGPLSVDRLTEAVKAAIDGGRVGIPSVVRWYMRTGPDAGPPAATARTMLAAAAKWLGGDPATVATFGKAGAAETVLHASWPTGAGAVLTAASGPGETASDLILLGSRGAIYFGRTPEGPES